MSQVLTHLLWRVISTTCDLAEYRECSCGGARVCGDRQCRVSPAWVLAGRAMLCTRLPAATSTDRSCAAVKLCSQGAGEVPVLHECLVLHEILLQYKIYPQLKVVPSRGVLQFRGRGSSSLHFSKLNGATQTAACIP